ncbi:MAG: hypothetical protein O3B73_10485, partial [bacterium]|nr:hypothetical protein [bacterium]
MGLIREFGRNARVLPVIMDDITVNFDPERAAHAVAALRELSEKHQVIVFTCHPATRDLFENLDAEAGVRVLHLDRQGVPTTI